MIAFQAVEDYLRGLASTEPLMGGLADVIFAPDRQAVLTAVEHCPDLLTDRAEAGFSLVALLATDLGTPRVTEVIERSRASVQALCEARA